MIVGWQRQPPPPICTTSESVPSVLGDGAILLHRVAYALDSVRARLTAYGERLFESEERTRPLEDLRRLTQEMEGLTEELSEEFGADHEAVAALAAARVAAQEIIETLDRFKGPVPQGATDVPTSPEDALYRIEEPRTNFDASRDRFMAAVREWREKEQA